MNRHFAVWFGCAAESRVVGIFPTLGEADNHARYLETEEEDKPSIQAWEGTNVIPIMDLLHDAAILQMEMDWPCGCGCQDDLDTVD